MLIRPMWPWIEHGTCRLLGGRDNHWTQPSGLLINVVMSLRWPMFGTDHHGNKPGILESITTPSHRFDARSQHRSSQSYLKCSATLTDFYPVANATIVGCGQSKCSFPTTSSPDLWARFPVHVHCSIHYQPWARAVHCMAITWSCRLSHSSITEDSKYM
jgi:hypothetical protein